MYLNCKTRFSFLYGTFETEELVKTAVEVGANAVALTNINSTCDVCTFYFERFLNPHRSSPPDFDIDFSWKDRDEVIDYIFKR